MVRDMAFSGLVQTAHPQRTDSTLDLSAAIQLDAATPLYKRAPCIDEQGKPLSDFMMIIPQLRSRTHAQIQDCAERIHRVLGQFKHLVVFADLNLRINVLWVSVRPSPGACMQIPAALIAEIPEALLVSHPRLY